MLCILMQNYFTSVKQYVLRRKFDKKSFKFCLVDSDLSTFAECHMELFSTIGFLYRNMMQRPKPEAVVLPKTKLSVLENHFLLNPWRQRSCIHSSKSTLNPLCRGGILDVCSQCFALHSLRDQLVALRVRPKQVGLNLMWQKTDLR